MFLHFASRIVQKLTTLPPTVAGLRQFANESEPRSFGKIELFRDDRFAAT
jgi:hypothetical protein